MEAIQSDLFKPVTLKRSFEGISDQIKELIYSKALKPHDRLPSERELAVRFNTGRMAVREGLRMLEESGFIYVKQGAEGGTFVKKLDATGLTKSIMGLIKVGNITLQEITEARVAVECILLESGLENITEEHMTALEANIQYSEQLCNEDDSVEKRMSEPLINFHILLAEASQNQLFKYFLKSLVDLSSDHVRKYIPGITRSTNHLKQHKAIYEAVKAKDLKRAQKALKDHLYEVAKHIDQSIRRTE